MPPLAPGREKAKAEKGVEQSKKGRATFCGGRSSPKKACATVGTFLTGVTQGGRPPWGVFLITFWARAKSNRGPPRRRIRRKRVKVSPRPYTAGLERMRSLDYARDDIIKRDDKKSRGRRGLRPPTTLFRVCYAIVLLP